MPTHKASHKATAHKATKTLTHKAASNAHKTVWCVTCKKNVDTKSYEIVSMKMKGGRTGKRLAGVGVCGHKVSKIVKSSA